MKQKKNTKVEPTNSEKSASDVYQQLEISIENFQKLRPDPDSIEFVQFIRDFEVFLKEETNPKLLNYFSPKIIQDIIFHVCSKTFYPDLIHKILHLLNIIVSKTGVTFSAISYITLFLFLTNGDEERFDILKSERIIIDIFSDENFFYDFIDESLFNLTFQKLFLTVSSKEICQFYTNLIFKVSPLHLLSNYDFRPIIENFHQQRPNETVFPEISVFLSGLFSINNDFKFYFNERANFELLSELLSKAPFDTIIECFTYLIFIEPPNFSLLKNIVDFYKKNLRIQDQFFDYGFQLIQSHPEIAIEINSIVPLSDWATPKISISKLIFAIKLVNSINTSLVSQFLPSYFSLLLNENESIDNYLYGICIVESQIFHHQITLEFLLNSLFLKAFIVQPTIDILGEIFKKSDTFAQIVYDVYSLPNTESIRPEVLDKIIQVVMKYNELLPIVSGFLAISGTSENLREVMKIIESSKNGNLCESLSFSFLKSDYLADNFLKEYGLKWIDSIFNQKIIDIQMVKNLIRGLVQRLAIQNIDDYIESLPKNHPLFSLDENDIRSLIYGFESPSVYFPIKTYSLFHLIPCPTEIDSYNASVLGRKNVLKKYENFMNLPIINQIGNRYITDDLFYEFLKTPTELERFSDISYDHFPLFQVFEYATEKNFEMKFISISFWFRFASRIDESLKIPIFHTSKFSLFYQKDNLIAIYEGIEYSVPINPLKWNHIFVSISPKVLSHQIKIRVNLNKAVFTSPTKLLELEDFGFLAFASYLFIGPAIRIYKSKTHDLNQIFEMGPSSLIKLNEDHLIVPSSDFLADKNILPVLYYGFPEHFKSEKKLDYFFEILKKTIDDLEFDKILSLYFKIFLVLKNSNINLFSSLLNFFSSIPEKLTKERFYNILDFFGKCKNKKKLIDEIIQNKLFWKNVSNDLIIYSLISYFKNFEFYEDINRLQFYLSSKISSNKNIINLFLDNSTILPICQKCLLKLFQCHHIMYQKQSKEIQCRIQIPKNSNIKEETQINNNDDDQYLQIINKRNISIQCEIEDENNSSQFENKQFLLFQNIKNTELQFKIIDCLYDFFKKTENIENIKLILPIDELMSLFIVSQNSFKASLFKIIILIERKLPGTFIVNNLFITSFFPLFIYQNVWDEVISLFTSDNGTTIKNSSMICLLLALIWSFTVVSLHSVTQTGKIFQLSFCNEMIKFCLSNVNVISMNKNTQNFIRSWIPLLFGFESSKNDLFIQLIKIENIEINPPRVSDFIHHIWEAVIQEARTIDENLPMKTDKFYLNEFKSFIQNSDIIIFLINIILSSSKDQIIHAFSPILCIPLTCEKEVSDTFVTQFVTSCFTILSQTSKLETLFIPFSQILHYISSCGLMKTNFNFILSNYFAIVTLLRDLYSKSFKKLLSSINNLMINIFSNCDNENLPDLFNILQQKVKIFIEIIQSTNSIDIYLTFFQKVAHVCEKEFDSFFKKFLDVSKIDRKNKKVVDILNHVEIQDNSAMNKWNKVVNSFSSITKIVHNEKNNCLSSLMSELHIISKEFSKIYFISQKRQFDFSVSLKRIFDSTENIQNLQEYFDYSINNLFESNQMNEKQKKLLPFSFPSSLPRLFVPAPIQSSNEAIEFIIENKLYLKEVKTSSEILIDDYEKVSKSIFKKINKKKFSQSQMEPLPTQVTNEDNEKEMKRRQSMVSSTTNANLIFNPIEINCQLKRFHYSIPTILSLTSHHLNLIPFNRTNTSPNSSSFCPSGNFPLEPDFTSQFIMDVINGLWGKTTVSNGRIIIQIPINSIIAINSSNSKSVTFWTLNCGTFILDNIESDIFEKKPFSELNLFTSQDRAINENEVIQKWIEGSVSTSQMIVLLNICEGKNYVDQNNFIQFPGSFSVFGTFSPINESLHSNLIEGRISGTEKYSNSIELKENINSIYDFIKKFDINCQIEAINRPSPHFTVDSSGFCQKISGKIPSFSLFDNNSIIKNLPPLSARISDSYPFYLVVDRGDATVYLFDLQSNKKNFVYSSENFSIAKSISVSKNFMFFAVDMNNDISHIYRIVYEKELPSKIEFIKKCSFLYDQITAVNDSELIAATFSGKTVYLWPFYRFSYHRVINFERKIRFCKFDDNSGTFWVCDNFSCFLFDLNGKMFSNHKFDKEITAFEVIKEPISECQRTVICGFIDGSICLVSPRIESAELFVKELKKCHQSEIVKIAFNPQNTYFLTIDDCQNAFFWTKKNVDRKANEVDINIFESCQLCSQKPSKFCSSCKRAFCSQCLKDNEICPECSTI